MTGAGASRHGGGSFVAGAVLCAVAGVVFALYLYAALVLAVLGCFCGARAREVRSATSHYRAAHY